MPFVQCLTGNLLTNLAHRQHSRAMDQQDRIEGALEKAFADVVGSRTPPRLWAALHLAVFGGGRRIRPGLLYEVFEACGGDDHDAADAAAAALEFAHCGSLVHDDLPCFDDADLRRGRPTVHKAYSEALAVLVGDALIVGGFTTISLRAPSRAGPLCTLLAQSLGAGGGLVAGQGWESEPQPDLATYHQAKTASLFEAAVCMGAVCAGQDPDAWRTLGTRIGEAYQIADDLIDVVQTRGGTGKTAGRDAALGRPSAASSYGVDGAFSALDRAVRQMYCAVPQCPGRERVLAYLGSIAQRLVPVADQRVVEAVGWATV